MTPGERFKNWIFSLAESWKDTLRGWLFRTIGEGITKFAEDMEPGAIEAYTAYITKLKDNPHTPPEVKAFYEKTLTPGNPFSVFGGIVTMVLGSFGALLGGSVPVGNFMRYDQERLLQSFRLDPMAIITAWRRDNAGFAWLFDDLKDEGWTDERIEALKFLTLFYPAPADLVNWQAKEVFEPEMIAKYGLDDELGGIQKEPFYKAGMTDEQITNFWRAHWEHASWMQIVEMLHRGLVTEEEVRDWFRLVEIPPFWRQHLIDTAYTWPTRVDVRRWWDMRTIDEARLKELYSGMGYRGRNLDDYVKWTKVYTDFPMMMSRFSNGWITEEDIRTWLRGLEIPEERITQFIQEKTKPEKAARTTTEKDLTKTEIYKGVKKELISWEEGLELLQDMGYDEDEADYILSVNVGVLEGSPDTFADFKDWTTKYKIATGREAKPMPEEIKIAAAQVVKLTAEVEALNQSITEEERGLIDVKEIPEAATRKLKRLQVARNRAISELERVKSDYERQVAEWRQERR